MKETQLRMTTRQNPSLEFNASRLYHENIGRRGGGRIYNFEVYMVVKTCMIGRARQSRRERERVNEREREV